MNLTVLKFVGVLCAIGLVAAVVLYVQRLRYDRDQALISKHNVEAAADSIKIVWADDSVRIAQRLAFLNDTVSDLRKKLAHGGTSAATTVIVVRPDSVATVHTTVVEGDAIKELADSLVGPPADVRARVRVFGATADWSWRLVPTPFTITVDVGCRGRLDPDVLVQTPTWVKLDSLRTVVRQNVCGAPAPRPRTALKLATWLGLVLVGTQIHSQLHIP